MDDLRKKTIKNLLIVNITIPVVMNILREQFTGLYNWTLKMSIKERIIFSIRPVTYSASVIFAVVIAFVVLLLIKPLLDYIKDGSNYEKARVVSKRLPWILIVIHLSMWTIAVTIFYAFVWHWKSPGGLPYFWALSVALAFGLLTGVYVAQSVNNALLNAKKYLRIKSINEDEKDLFVRYKDYFIFASSFISLAVILTYIGKFYTSNPDALLILPPLPASALIVSLFFGGFYMFMLHLSKLEYNFQTGGLRSKISEISEAEGDLTKQITLINFDEMGIICTYFNKLLGNLGDIIKNIKDSSESLTLSFKDLTISSQDTFSAVGEITNSIAKTTEETSNQVRSVEHASSSIEQITRNIVSLDSEITSQASSVAESSAAVEEMVASINSVSRTIEKIASHFEKLVTASDVGKERINFVETQINSFEEQSRSLEQANQLIANIAAQTNLLAMNAAIEAAHAGDSGRGFAVVADEIRSLAENSQKHSKTIRDELKKTHQIIDTVISASLNAKNAFVEVDEMIQTASHMEQEIKQSMEEQSAGSKEVLIALRQINDITATVKNSAGEMTDGIGVINEEIHALLNKSKTISTNIEDISRQTDRITSASERIKKLETKNMDQIESLTAVSSKFKLRS